MNRTVETFVLILLFPALLETIDFETFGIIIPGPLSVGRWTFILSGLIGLSQSKNIGLNTNIFNAFLFILFGCAIGGFWGKDYVGNFSKIIAFLLLVLGAIGIAPYWNTGRIKKLLATFFIGNLIFWSYHVIDVCFLRGGVNSYSVTFLLGFAINHHIVGQAVSVSSLFLAINFFYRNGKLSIPGYLIIVWAVVICLLSETRSNFLFTILGAAIVVFRESKNFSRLIFVIMPLLYGAFYVMTLFFFENEAVKKRFDVNDIEYHENTTEVRFKMIQEGITSFISNPQGLGMLNMTVKINEKYLMLHNQFLSFMIGGGLLAFIGVLVWIIPFVSFFIRVIRYQNWRINDYPAFTIAIMVSTMVFYITLFTVESTGILFYLLLSLSAHSDLVNKGYIAEGID